jgi:CubicO group peptidase (beta-lactamase class C family)
MPNFERGEMPKLKLMDKFPPSPAAQVTLANWRTSPFNKWAFQHVRELIPTADVPNDPAAVWAIPLARRDWDGLVLDHAGHSMSFPDFLDETGTDGIVILHRGQKVFEAYPSGMEPDVSHIWMSVSKSILGIVAGILVEQKWLQPDEMVTAYVPEISETAYARATVRDLLDMRVGVAFDEDYTATSGRIIEYRKAQNWDSPGPGDPPSDLRSFFRSLSAADGEHGGRFHYVSPNTDLLGWVVERASGRRYADLLSELLWGPLGARSSAYITVDRLGAPRAAGGFCATVEDLARVGQLIVQGGRRNNAEVIPKRWIDDITYGGSAEAWDRGDFVPYFPGLPMHYRSKWYVTREDAPMLFGVGVFGQNLFVDPKNEIVIAKCSSQASAMDERLIAITTAAITRVRAFLAGGKS